MKSSRRRAIALRSSGILALVGFAVASPAIAQTPPASKTPPTQKTPPAQKALPAQQSSQASESGGEGASASAPGAAGQQALAVRAGAQGITARVCASGACSPDGGAALPVPAEALPLFARSRPSVAAVALADGKHLVRVEARGARDPERWVMLVAAPLNGKGSEPVVIWSGFTGVAKGEHGEERSTVVVEERLAKGSRFLVGEQRGDVTICGRPTLVAAREVSPVTLTLEKGAVLQNLTPEERAKAVKITAARAADGKAPAGARLLKATAASSAVEKKFATLTDGDLATAWSENKAGQGRGEFVSMSSSNEIGITSVDIALGPEDEGAGTVAPRTVYLATEDRLFEVAIPDDAGRKAGGVYEAKLPEEVRASCLAVVLEDAYVPRGVKSPRVTIAEVSARTSLGDLDLPALAGALAGGGERAKAAAALLMRGGSAATKAAADAYAKLDDEGKRLALGVIETAPCGEQVPFFAERLLTPAPYERAKAVKAPPSVSVDPETDHALDRIRRCGRAAAPALAQLIASGPDRTKSIAAAEIALVAPGEAVPVLLDAIPKAGDALRKDLRIALAHAAKNERAKGALATEIELEKFRARGEVVQIDLLRAMGPRLAVIEGSSKAFGLLAVPGASFRTRFLLQAPAAELARGGDAAALAFLKRSLRADLDPHIRARAAEVAGRVPALMPDLVAAVDDADARVREGAILAIGRAAASGEKTAPGASSAIAKRLGSDPWTFIRSGAAGALGSLPASADVDLTLAEALGDRSVDVRGRAIDALGAHRAKAYAEPIRDRSEDPEENVEVRARAILALASMCDEASLEEWTKLAHRAARPLDERDRRLGSASVAALGMMRPRDLQKRLAPLLGKDAPPGIREAARAALSAEGVCK